MMLSAALAILSLASDGEPLPPVKAESADPGIFRIQRNGLWGYIDRTGRILVEPRFAAAGDFFDGLAAAQTKPGWGYIRSTGDFAVTPRFTSASDFRNGRAIVHQAATQAATVIRTDGSVVGVYREVKPYSDGLAAFREGEKWGFLDAEGNVAIRPRFDDVWPFSSGFARVWDKVKKRYGVIGRLGHLTADYVFSVIGPFDGGLAAARLADTGACGFTDGGSTFTIAATDWCFDKEVPEGYGIFRDGFAAVFQDQNLAMYVDKSGRKQIPWLSQWTLGFSEGLAPIQLDDGYWTYLDTAGHHPFDLRFTEAYPFRDGLALVKAHDGWHYLRKDGTIAVRNVYESN